MANEWFSSVLSGRGAVDPGLGGEAAIAELQRRRRELDGLRLGFAVGIPLLVLLMGWNLYRVVSSVDGEKTMAALEQRVTRTIWPTLSAEAQRLGRELTPVFLRTFGDRLEARASDIDQAMEAELAQLQSYLEKTPVDVQQAMGRELTGRFAEMLAQKDPSLDPATRQTIAGDAAHRVTAWTQQRLADVIEQNVKSLLAIKQTLDGWKLGEGAKANSSDVLTAVLEVLGTRLEEEKEEK